MVLEQFRLDGKVAVVTGASRGLGAAMAVGLAQAGANVAAVARGDVAETLAGVEAAGRCGVGVRADVGERGSAARIIEEVRAALGRVDILVNNAGIILRAELLEFSEADWDAVMKVNLDGVFFLSQAAARAMVEQGSGGKIVNIASLLSFQGGIRVPSYTASKHGVLGLTRLMANELAPKGIQVNAIAPGYMATDNTKALQEDPVRSRQILERIPAGRWGRPSDMAGAVVFLASGASDYVTGQVVAVDGGWLAR